MKGKRAGRCTSKECCETDLPVLIVIAKPVAVSAISSKPMDTPGVRKSATTAKCPGVP